MCRQSLPRVSSPRWSPELCLRGTADKKGIRLCNLKIIYNINVIYLTNQRQIYLDEGIPPEILMKFSIAAK